ncbi:Chaperone [Roseibacterium elongatum DSM 19469]|uniref:Chaperone n=1 Tax=Roseicyclus elongatus DSM 19469 TaxID=1294273 RepID=W8RS41_9RHOB|nr:ATP12 family protein [Roseibacterium elongatum]AHM03974.1 Chaperone [Roseibacterium elongatum DSM 19469]
MTEWKAKRFWKQATVTRDADGWQVLLDGRPVRTPAKAAMILPSEDMAQAIALEWDAQQDEIAPLTMPVTRSANAAIDRVATQHAEVAEMLAAYGETDLLCHRADHPDELVARQTADWDPLLDWAADRLGARLFPTAGVLPVAQPRDSLDRLGQVIAETGPFRLTALHDLVTLSGSAVLGLAVAYGRLPPDDAWRLSRIDEDWQIEQWGRDEEADAMAAHKAGQFSHAAWFWHLASGE